MAEVVTLPKLGLSEFGEVVALEAAVGDRVEADDVLVVIESDKASAEVRAPRSGVLLTTYVEEGEELEIEPGRPLAVIGEAGETAPSLADLEAPEADLEETAAATTDAAPDEPAREADTGAADSGDVTATPRARRAAREHDVDLAAIEGTGPQGAVSEADVEEHLERESAEDVESAVEPASADGADEPAETTATADDLTVAETRTLSGTRKTIAERLSRSAREKPHVMGTREVSVERLQEARGRLDAELDVAVTLNDLLLHFVGRTLEDLPQFNAHFVDGEHRLFEEVNVGYAVDSEKGLVVPVVDEVPDRPLAELAETRRRKVERVLADEHDPADLQGGTFTVTNVGVFDMEVSYSIINPPQVAILAVGRRKPAAVERRGEVRFEESVTLSLTIDHRVLDGGDSGRFLDQLAEYVEYPGRVFDAF